VASRLRKSFVLAVAVAVAQIAAPASSSAATQIGHTFLPTGVCTSHPTFLQAQYSAPSDGVITSFAFQGDALSAPQLKFKVARLVSGSTYSIVGESGVVSPATSTLNQFPVRIPVKAGDLIGEYLVTDGGCDQPNASFTELYYVGDLAPGAQASFGSNAYQMDLSASLEPDADHDGYGDETQDQCPTDASTHGPCPSSTPSPSPHKRCHRKKHKSGAVISKKCKKRKG
jgi:hypothetical protein